MGNSFLHFSEAFDYIEEKGCDQAKNLWNRVRISSFLLLNNRTSVGRIVEVRAFAPGSCLRRNVSQLGLTSSWSFRRPFGGKDERLKQNLVVVQKNRRMPLIPCSALIPCKETGPGDLNVG